MIAGDEFYDDDVTSVILDPLAAADFRRDQLKHTSSCAKCCSPEPARLGDGHCSDCGDYPRCGVCARWVGDGSGWLPGYVVALTPEGTDLMVCTFCWEATE